MKLMKAFIFDMDGVLIDTEPIHGQLIAEILAKYNIDIDPADLEQYSGMTSTAVFELFVQKYQLPIKAEELTQKHFEAFCEYVATHKLQPIEGIIDLLRRLQSKNIPMAIASSSAMPTIKLVAQQLEIADFFQFFVSGEDLVHSKPAPDIYLKTAKILDVAPADCVVLEDSTHGATAAVRAGMYCIGFDPKRTGKQDLSMANEIVYSPSQIILD